MILAYATIFGLVQIVCTWLGSRLLFKHLREKDERHERQVNGLLNRIQAPTETVLQELVPEDALMVPAVGFDNDQDYWDKQERQWRRQSTNEDNE